MRDEEDLVGSTMSKAPRGRQRTRPDILGELTAKARMGQNGGNHIVEDMMAGVTVSWLSQVFGMDPKTIKAKLADCPPLMRRKAGYVYSLPVACRYLIPPAISAEQYLKTMKASELPPSLQQTFWDAALKRQRWEENAGQLWRTERVREVLGSTFQTIKFTVQLWADTLERQTGLSHEQRALLIELVDTLQKDLYDALVKQAAAKKTGPQKSEMREMLGEPEVEEDPEDDYSHLV